MKDLVDILWLHDTKIALRRLTRTPFSTLVGMATLAFSMGASSAIYSITEVSLLPYRHYKNPNQLVNISISKRGQALSAPVPGHWINSYRNVSAFESSAIGLRGAVNLYVGGEPRGASAVSVSSNFFSVVGVKGYSGRLFTERDGDTGSVAKSSIITYGFAKSLRADGNVIGERLEMDGMSIEIVGVLPKGWRSPPQFPSGSIYLPLSDYEVQRKPDRFYFVLGRLKSSLSKSQALAELRSSSVPHIYGSQLTPVDYEPVISDALTKWETKGGKIKWSSIVVLIGAVFMLHTLACLNVGSLVLMRTLQRRDEIGIKLALGGSRWAVLRPHIIEGCCIVFLGVVASLFVARWIMPILFLVSGAEEWAVWDITWNTTLWIYVLILASATALATTAIPLWIISRSEGAINANIREKGYQALGETPRLKRSRAIIITVAVSLSAVLFVFTGALLEKLTEWENSDLGIDLRDKYIISTQISRLARQHDDLLIDRYFNICEKIEQIFGVGSASFASRVVPTTQFLPRSMNLLDASGHMIEVQAECIRVTPNFHGVLGVRVLSGDPLSALHRTERDIVIVNEAFLRRYLNGRDPIGSYIDIRPGSRWEIRGVVSNVRSLLGDVHPRIYYPYWQSDGSNDQFQLLIEVAGLTGPDFYKRVSQAVHQERSDVVITNIMPLESYMYREVHNERSTFALLRVLSVISLFLLLVGIFTLSRASVKERTPEIAFRMAIGATPGNIIRHILARELLPVLTGIALGMGLSLLLIKGVSSFEYGMTDITLSVYLPVAVLQIVASIVACSIPIRQAICIQPAKHLHRSL